MSNNYLSILLSIKHISLPLEEPLLIFSVVLFVILFSPIILGKIKIPGIIGLIISGVLLGPHGFHILENDSSFKLFGFVGLLYLMFMAGLELDMNEFRKNKYKSIVFGLLTFGVPIGIGYVVCYYFLQFSVPSSLLVASMFATHTLVSYPIVSRLGLTKEVTVNVAIGGTVITDSAVLLLLAVITGTAKGELDTAFWVQLIISLAIFGFIVFWVYPKLATWFFKNIRDDKTTHYIFVLALVFLGGFMVELASIEPIVGAFMTGLALNRLIPHTSPLMNRIEFVGNSLFIPFFLIGIGMMVDLSILLQGPEALIFTGILLVVAFSGKWIAAWLTAVFFKFSKQQRKLLYGLSTARAAATVAIVLTAYNLKVDGVSAFPDINEQVLNATILLVLVTCLIASFVTESAGKQLVIDEGEKTPVHLSANDRVLLPVDSIGNIEYQIDLAIALKKPKSNTPIYPMSLVINSPKADEDMAHSYKILEKALVHASASENQISPVTRVALNITNGISNAIRELGITEVIMEWHEREQVREFIFGSEIQKLVSVTEKLILFSKMTQPLNTFKNLVLWVPDRAELEIGFDPWVEKMFHFSGQIKSKIKFYCSAQTVKRIEKIRLEMNFSGGAEFDSTLQEVPLEKFLNQLDKNDLLIVVSARKGSISYMQNTDDFPDVLTRLMKENSFILLYPEQNVINTVDHTFKPGDIDVTHITQNLARINKLGRTVKKILTKPDNSATSVGDQKKDK